jgi:hypothetical protein
MKQTSVRKEPKILVMLVPLLFTLMPRPEIEGVQFLTYPLLGLVVLITSVFYFKKLELNRNILFFLTLVLLYSFALSLSTMFSENITINSFTHIFKPLLFAVLLLFGFIVGNLNEYETVKKGLLKSARFILLAQVIVGIPQLFSITMFDALYSSEMARPLGQLLRIVGTLGNPNIFAWMVIQSSVIILLMEKNKSKKLFWLLIGASLIVLSGSRTSFVLFPTVIIACKLLRVRKNLIFFFMRVPIYIVTLVLSFFLMIWLIERYADYFPYLSQLLQILDTGKLTSVSSFNTRTIIWHNAWTTFTDKASLITWLFGLGPGAFDFIDCDYLYSLVTYGIVGFIINLFLYLSLFIMFSKLEQKELKVLGQQYIIFSLIIGYQAETLSGWNYPLLIMFFAGLAIALNRKNKNLTSYN